MEPAGEFMFDHSEHIIWMLHRNNGL